MSSAPHQRVTGILVVHGVGAQGRGESVQKLLKGLSLVEGAEVPVVNGDDPVEARVAGMPLRLYEVHWADLLQGDATRGTFSAAEFQASAWFPWLNWRRKVNPPGKYSLATTVGWTLFLPLVSLALALPYYGARLFAQGFDRKAARRLEQQLRDDEGLTFFQRARALANGTASQRTFLEDTIDEYVGDVFNYVNSAGQARFPDGRDIDVPRDVQDAYDAIAERFRTQLLKAADECDDLQVLAHSLGTVVSYHGLFGLRRGDTATADGPELDAARKKVSRLYTIGSPLEKIGFFWPKLIDPEVAAGSRTLHWENFVSWFDPVAGVLEHFDQWGAVRNQRLLGGGFVTGHVVYEKHPKFLRRFVSGLGAENVTLKRTGWQTFRDWAILLGETLLAPVGLGILTFAGGAIWLAVAFVIPWLVSLLFRPDFMPQIDPVIFDRVGVGIAVMMLFVFLVNSRNDAARFHAAAWTPDLPEEKEP
jgi:hypothetical protein